MAAETNLLLEDHRLTTAEITYHLPDHPGLLQTFVWQALDTAPEFPILRRFLDYWSSNLDGRLHSVRVAHVDPINHGRFRNASWLSVMH